MPDHASALETLLHELRTPLGVASGFVQLLSEDRLATSDARERAWSRITAALARMAEICNEATRKLATSSSVDPEARS